MLWGCAFRVRKKNAYRNGCKQVERKMTMNRYVANRREIILELIWKMSFPLPICFFDKALLLQSQRTTPTFPLPHWTKKPFRRSPKVSAGSPWRKHCLCCRRMCDLQPLNILWLAQYPAADILWFSPPTYRHSYLAVSAPHASQNSRLGTSDEYLPGNVIHFNSLCFQMAWISTMLQNSMLRRWWTFFSVQSLVGKNIKDKMFCMLLSLRYLRPV